MGVRISEKDFHYFTDHGTLARYSAGAFIFTRGESAQNIYLIRSGRVLVSTTTKDGQMVTLEVLKKGELFGEGALVSHYIREVDISAVTDVELIVCETETLLPVLVEHNELMILMFRHMTELANRLAHQLVRLSRYSGRQKVADYNGEHRSKRVYAIYAQ